MEKFSPKYSRLAIYIIAILTVAVIIKNHTWTNKQIISEDTNYYYIYLPATFIYHDLTLQYVNEKLPEEARSKSWYLLTDDKKHRTSKMSCGYAIMNMPFFLTAHVYAMLAGNPANGYSIPYKLALCIAAFFYFVVAMVYQRKILLHFFDDTTTTYTLLAIALATNLFYYTVYCPGMTHVFSFCLFTLFIRASLQWHVHPKLKSTVVLGLLLALIALVRPSNVIIGLFPFLYGSTGNNLMKGKLLILKHHWKLLFAFFISFVIGIIPQLLIWKIQAGNFIYYSYIGEKFFFNHPHIFDGLFSFRNGLFIYTPVLLFAIPGFIFAFKRKQSFALAGFVFFILNCFIVFSWWCWWYGGSFGMRAMVESYALLSLPVALFISEMIHHNTRAKYILGFSIIFFIALNQFQSTQAQSSLLHYDSMTSRAYIKIFGRTSWPRSYDQLIESPDYENARRGLAEREPYLRQFPFQKITHQQSIHIKAENGKFISSDKNFGGLLVANRDVALGWETFTLTRFETGTCILTNDESRFVTVDFVQGGKLIANRNEAGKSELFTYIPFSDSTFALKASNEKYVAADSTGMLYAKSDQPKKGNSCFKIVN